MMKVSELKEKMFSYNYLRIDTSRNLSILAIADEDYDIELEKYNKELENYRVKPAILHEALKASQVGFSLYALAILHCASVLENNRAEILKRISDISPKELKDRFKKDEVTKLLKRVSIEHESICNFTRSEEFREVANKIKHARFAFSESVKLNSGNIYYFDDLRELYKHRVELQDYLKDLFDKINAVNQG